ncbi:MAG: tetratricopeptide repeat protein [bacterium]
MALPPRPPRRATALAALAHAALASLAPAAVAQPAPGVDPATAAQVEQFNRTGMDRYEAGDYAAARVLFEEALALFPDPKLVYNIGRCHEELGQRDAAIARFEALAADETASAELREKAAARLAPLVAARDAIRTAPPPPPPPPPRDTSTAWILIGSGAAGAAVGGVFLTLGLADHAELERSRQGQGTPISADREQRLDDEGSSKKLIGGVLIGLGVAAAGTGTWLLLDDAPEDQAVRLTPFGAGAALTARF